MRDFIQFFFFCVTVAALIMIIVASIAPAESTVPAPILTEEQADRLIEQAVDRIDFWYGVAEEQGAFDD